MQFYIGDHCYPWGNHARAKIVDVGSRLGLFTVEFLEDNWADFGGFKVLIFGAGDRVDNVREEYLYEEPQNWIRKSSRKHS